AYGAPTTGFAFTNNIVEQNLYGMATDGGVALSVFFPNSVIDKNVVVGGGTNQPVNFMAVGFLDMANGNYRLSATSLYKGAASNGKDPGADVDALLAATGGSTTTPPSPTPTPNPSPTATPAATPTPNASPTPQPTPPPSSS